MRRLNEADFDQALKDAQGTLVVKFYANWCPDCRRIEGAYEQFPERYTSLEFAEVFTEESPALAERFDVKGIPTFLVFRNGDLVDRLYSRDAKTVKQVEDFVVKQVEATV